MKLAVRNFQSLGSVDLDVAGLTVLVGPSNRGKSALVRAVEAVLFNKPGDEFIRTGKKQAEVVVEGLPGVGAVHWVKGKSKTAYTVNGETFGKLGGGTPPALEAAGYRDIWVGDKDRKKGEWIRPQVSLQHDPLFLLNRSGAFVSDVLGTISRHAVLLTAQGRATGDQRAAKQRLGLKQTDLAAATASLGALDDVPAFAGRVEALRAAYERRDQLAATVAHLRSLVARRARYADVAAVEPRTESRLEVVPKIEWGFRTIWGLKGAAARRPALLALGGSTVPAPTDVPSTEVTWRITRLRSWVAQRPYFAPFLRELPAPTVVPPDLGTVLVKARGLMPYRPVLAALVNAPLPASLPDQLWGKLDAVVTLRDKVTGDMLRRAAALDQLYRCETAVRSTKVMVEEAEAELSLALGELTICPTCERPMEKG